MPSLFSRLALLCSLLTAACAAEAPDDASADRAEAYRQAMSKTDQPFDGCEAVGYYGDGICDDFCPKPDPDCDSGCPEYYFPVCGTNGMTYSNSCFAQAAGVGIAHNGECTNPVLSNSCAGECGGGAPAGCYCDEMCNFYGDCCSDYAATCAS